RIQIRETLKSHFEKEKNLFKSNIKVLSLFFIDEVSKYKYYEDSQALKGRYAQIFEEEYNYLLNENKNLLDVEYSKYLESFETGKIHAGYFSIDKKGNAINSKLDNKKEGLSFDEGAYDLIMKDKERLLSLSEPVRFIFSHSALREGWDNPNIFQICTLKHSESTISKRQEIGRGLRICVNGNGERMDYSKLESDFHSINNLTIIANESYDSFSKDLQKEISDSLTERPKSFDVTHFINKVLVNDSGNQVPIDSILFTKISMHCLTNDYIDKDTLKVTDNMIQAMNNDTLEVLPELEEFKDEYINLMKKLYLNNNTSLISNERKSTIKNLVPNDNFNKKEFQDLWNKINVKTIYEVDFDTAALISKSVDAINTKFNVTTTKVKITEGNQKDTFDSVSLKASESMKEVSSKIQSFDITSMSQIKYDLIGEIVKDTKLTRKTIIAILQKITENKFEMFKINPEEFIRRTSKLINEEKAATVINGITYHKTDQIYSNDIFTINNISGEVDKNAFDVKKHIYDFLITDSNIERKFAEKLETGEVTVYAKLPNGFKIPTPVGNYNPDWAIVFDNEDFKYVYFIAETKGTMDSLELRQTEKAKIECAKKHFECISNNSVKYDVVDSYKNLIDLLV
ncbi:MAG: restriction endonuclease subunit R, partial [Peptostreptococcaceae bacterium]